MVLDCTPTVFIVRITLHVTLYTLHFFFLEEDWIVFSVIDALPYMCFDGLCSLNSVANLLASSPESNVTPAIIMAK